MNLCRCDLGEVCFNLPVHLYIYTCKDSIAIVFLYLDQSNSKSVEDNIYIRWAGIFLNRWSPVSVLK